MHACRHTEITLVMQRTSGRSMSIHAPIRMPMQLYRRPWGTNSSPSSIRVPMHMSARKSTRAAMHISVRMSRRIHLHTRTGGRTEHAREIYHERPCRPPVANRGTETRLHQGRPYDRPAPITRPLGRPIYRTAMCWQGAPRIRERRLPRARALPQARARGARARACARMGICAQWEGPDRRRSRGTAQRARCVHSSN